MKKSIPILFFIVSIFMLGGQVIINPTALTLAEGAPWDLSGNTPLQYKCNDNAGNTTVTDDGSGATNGTSSTNTSNWSVSGKINEAFDFTAASSEYVNMNQTFQYHGQQPRSKKVNND